MSLGLEEVRTKVRIGERLSRDEAQMLFRHLPLAELGELANAKRQKLNPGNQVTFLIDRNINYTNVCNTDCSFCGFYRHHSTDPGAYVNSREVLADKIEEAQRNGATRILLQGGHNDELPYDYYIDLVSWIHDSYGIEINAFSPSEIQQMCKVSGRSAFQVLSELQQAGLAGLPGGGAEILDDEVRGRVSPKKISADTWIEIMEIAQGLSLTTTASMVIGFGETITNRLNHLDKLRDLQDRSIKRGLRGFGAFISWTLQHNQNTSLGRSRQADKYGAGVTEYLRNVALCRIYLDNIQHHQGSWPTLGVSVAEISLHFGCDDIGSTMMEENVVSAAGGPSKSKWSMTPEELMEAIRSAGYTPAQRNSSYEILKKFA